MAGANFIDNNPLEIKFASRQPKLRRRISPVDFVVKAGLRGVGCVTGGVARLTGYQSCGKRDYTENHEKGRL